MIHRHPSNSKLEKRWTKEEDELLRMMLPSSSPDILIAAFPNLTWKAIRAHMHRLKLHREKSKVKHWHRWTLEEDNQLQRCCREGMSYEEISRVLGRSIDSVIMRIWDKGLSTYHSGENRENQYYWEASDLISFQELPSGGEHRGRISLFSTSYSAPLLINRYVLIRTPRFC